MLLKIIKTSTKEGTSADLSPSAFSNLGKEINVLTKRFRKNTKGWLIQLELVKSRILIEFFFSGGGGPWFHTEVSLLFSHPKKNKTKQNKTKQKIGGTRYCGGFVRTIWTTNSTHTLALVHTLSVICILAGIFAWSRPQIKPGYHKTVLGVQG